MPESYSLCMTEVFLFHADSDRVFEIAEKFLTAETLPETRVFCQKTEFLQKPLSIASLAYSLGRKKIDHKTKKTASGVKRLLRFNLGYTNISKGHPFLPGIVKKRLS